MNFALLVNLVKKKKDVTPTLKTQLNHSTTICSKLKSRRGRPHLFYLMMFSNEREGKESGKQARILSKTQVEGEGEGGAVSNRSGKGKGKGVAGR